MVGGCQDVARVHWEVARVAGNGAVAGFQGIYMRVLGWFAGKGGWWLPGCC